MITTEEFERWWNQEGSAINPTTFEDTSEHVKRVSEIAWANGHYMATVTNLKSQQWHPIKTAPEFEWVLVPHEGRSVEARYELSNDGAMCWFQPRHNRCMEPKPTHWMPLPAPPMSDK